MFLESDASIFPVVYRQSRGPSVIHSTLKTPYHAIARWGNLNRGFEHKFALVTRQHMHPPTCIGLGRWLDLQTAQRIHARVHDKEKKVTLGNFDECGVVECSVQLVARVTHKQGGGRLAKNTLYRAL